MGVPLACFLDERVDGGKFFPVRLGQPIQVEARAVTVRSRLISTEAAISDGRGVLAVAVGKYSPLPPDRNRDFVATLTDEPQNAQAWLTRGLAYEKLGDKSRAAGSYGRAINLRPKDEVAHTGFARVGGKPGQSYSTF